MTPDPHDAELESSWADKQMMGHECSVLLYPIVSSSFFSSTRVSAVKGHIKTPVMFHIWKMFTVKGRVIAAFPFGTNEEVFSSLEAGAGRVWTVQLEQSARMEQRELSFC